MSLDLKKLAAAFEALERVGIVARQNWGNGASDGSGRMSEEIANLESVGGKIRGFVFYHSQDRARAEGGGGLLLAFGPHGPLPTLDMSLPPEKLIAQMKALNDEPTKKIGHEIVESLRKSGLTVEWNGDPNRRIEVV